jgi:hypothetical protein
MHPTLSVTPPLREGCGSVHDIVGGIRSLVPAHNGTHVFGEMDVPAVLRHH